MAYIEGHSRDQMLLLSASVDDYVSADNPVRFIAAFVDDLDLGELGLGRSRSKATGRPGYDPADLLIAVSLRLSQPGAVEPVLVSRDCAQP